MSILSPPPCPYECIYHYKLSVQLPVRRNSQQVQGGDLAREGRTLGNPPDRRTCDCEGTRVREHRRPVRGSALRPGIAARPRCSGRSVRRLCCQRRAAVGVLTLSLSLSLSLGVVVVVVMVLLLMFLLGTSLWLLFVAVVLVLLFLFLFAAVGVVVVVACCWCCCCCFLWLLSVVCCLRLKRLFPPYYEKTSSVPVWYILEAFRSSFFFFVSRQMSPHSLQNKKLIALLSFRVSIRHASPSARRGRGGYASFIFQRRGQRNLFPRIIFRIPPL